MAKTDPRDLVDAPALLKLLFPGKKSRSLRWLYLRIRRGDIPSRKVFNARVVRRGRMPSRRGVLEPGRPPDVPVERQREVIRV